MSTLTLPEQFGRYRILKKLGAGGMGAVYLAEDSLLGRQVALKVPHFTEEDGPTVIERFYREARAAAGLHHPNVCPVFDVGEVDGIHYLTMLLIEGEPLSRRVGPGRPWEPARAVDLVRRLALVLEVLHQKRLVHRDLKPGNIMIQPGGEPVLMDFGLARSFSDPGQRLTTTGRIVGTPAYMPPEQVRGDPDAQGPSSDVYALGIILYQVLTGQLPFGGPDVWAVLGQVLHAAPRPPSAVQAGLDPSLDVICLRAIEKDPGKRYPTMAEFARALQDWLRRERPIQLPPATALAPLGVIAPPTRIVPSSSCTQPDPSRLHGTDHYGPYGRELARRLTPEVTNSIGMKLVLISAGTFLMGSAADEAERNNDEEQHEVEITRTFYMGAYEVTQGQYEKVMGNNPSYISPTGGIYEIVVGRNLSQFPVENVSWDDATEFCKKLSELLEEKRAGRVYRLPTEAEWEYACRGGASSSTPFHFGDSLSSTQANFDGNYPYGGADKGPYLKRTTAVGAYPANAFGLYDMHGNVWEWCQDWYDKNYYKGSPREDPTGPLSGTRRVVRGGSWVDSGTHCRTAHRLSYPADKRRGRIGFRVVLVAGARSP